MKLETSVVIFQSLKERHQIKLERWDRIYVETAHVFQDSVRIITLLHP